MAPERVLRGENPPVCGKKPQEIPQEISLDRRKTLIPTDFYPESEWKNSTPLPHQHPQPAVHMMREKFCILPIGNTFKARFHNSIALRIACFYASDRHFDCFL